MNAPHRHPLHRNLSHAQDFTPLDVEGTLPPALRGTLYRAGPGIFERFGRRVRHAFLADGVISAVRLDGHGGAMGAAQPVRSAGYQEEEAAGRFLYGADVPWTRRVLNGLLNRTKHTGNTNIVCWQGTLMALMEGGLPVQLSAADLSVLAEDGMGFIRGPFSAHPHRVAPRKTTYNFGLRYGREMDIDLYALPDQGPGRHLGAVKAPWPAMVHDFIATERHLIFVISPLKLHVLKAILGYGDFDQLFRWDPTAGCALLMVDIDDPTNVRRVDLEAFWVWHFANAWVRSDGATVVEMARYPDGDSLQLIGEESDASTPPHFYRLIIPPTGAGVQWAQLFENPCDFPRIHPHHEGRRHRYVWVQMSVPTGGIGLARLDVERGTMSLWRPDEGQETSEPIFVPKTTSATANAGEGDGWVLSLIYDHAQGRSFLGVFDAAQMVAGPIAKIWFPQTIPLTFHGSWVANGSGRG